MNCQICQNDNLVKFLDLGNHPPPLNFVKKSQNKINQDLFPLQVFHCNTCGLVQLGNIVDPNIMFKEYTYTSGVSVVFKKHLNEFASYIVDKFKLTKNDLVIDIASNDGTLLDGFKKFGVKVLGVEPSNTAKIAINNNIPTINNFFSEGIANNILKDQGKAKIITATNVFAHVDKLDSFMKGIKLILENNGCFVSESQYLPDVIKKLEYDTIYHEHLRYYGLKQLVYLFKKYEMDVFAAEKIHAQGGSIRVFACFKNKFEISESVKEIIKEEDEMQYSSLHALENFAKKVQENKKELKNLLEKLKKEGNTIVGISAPARSSTVLNYCKIGPDILEYIAEKSTLKIGKLSPGMHIQVVDDNELKNTKPDYALLLSWHMKDSIMSKIRQDGFRGKFIIPLPNVEIV
jgi:2-polyprenyl-3-methyl-5-hydroxy-6-metoxy-1,4-benzoquinol methylase